MKFEFKFGSKILEGTFLGVISAGHSAIPSLVLVCEDTGLVHSVAIEDATLKREVPKKIRQSSTK